MYYATGTHEGIIDMGTFNRVQEGIRRSAGAAGRIMCGRAFRHTGHGSAGHGGRRGRMANVTVIPATRNIHTGVREDAAAKGKTVGYARVHTDSEEQLTSYEAQVDHYTNYIKSRPKWGFVNVLRK